MKAKIDDFQIKESDFETQIKKYVDLVKVLELQRNQVWEIRNQFRKKSILLLFCYLVIFFINYQRQLRKKK